MNTPNDSGSGERPDPEQATGPSGDSERQERQRASAELRRTSLAADPNRARKNLAYTVGGIALFLLFGLGLFAMQHHDPAPSSSAQDKPKIDESQPKSAPLDPSRQQAPASATSASVPAAASSAVDPELARREAMQRERQAAEAERERKKQEALLEARRKSAIFIDDSEGGQDGQPGDDAAAGGASADRAALLQRTHHRTGAGPNDPNSSFARAVANENDGEEKATKIDNLECKVFPGRTIDAQIQQRTISDLPGSVTLVVTDNVYGEKGRIPLIPWGTVITGKPNPVVQKGQERIFIASASAFRPDGATIHIDSPVADQLGSAGLDGEVDNHVGQILGMSAALSLLGAGASNYGASSSDQYNSQSAYRTSIQQSMAQSSQQMLGGYANIPPTIKSKQATRVRIQVEHVLDFSNYCRPDDTDSQ